MMDHEGVERRLEKQNLISSSLRRAIETEIEIHYLFVEGHQEGDPEVIELQEQAKELAGQLERDEPIVKEALAKILYVDRVVREAGPYIKRLQEIKDDTLRGAGQSVLQDQGIYVPWSEHA